MESVRQIAGTAVPLRRSDVDTDQIIPSDWLKRVERTGFGAGLFSEWREERDFVLNRPEHAGAAVLVAGPNFGVGSSREHAVWALEDYGFKAIVAPSFADIFFSNCTKIGLLPVRLAGEEVRALMDMDPTHPAEIDLEALEVRFDGRSVPFTLDAERRRRLLEGLDDIGLTLRHEAAISAFEGTRPAWLPVVA